MTWEEKDKIPLGATQYLQLAWAVQSLGEALASNSLARAETQATNAISGLNEFISNINNLEKLTEDQCDISSSLHGFLRKYDDTKAGTILYRMIWEQRGARVWFAFIRAITDKENGKNISAIFEAIDRVDTNITDDLIMAFIIKNWVGNKSYKASPLSGFFEFYEDRKA